MSINDKQSKFLNYILEDLLRETNLFFGPPKVVNISFPWFDKGSGVNAYQIPEKTNYKAFKKYIRNRFFDINDEETYKWLYDEYMFKIRVMVSDFKRNRLDESVDKEEVYKDYVVDNLIVSYLNIYEDSDHYVELIYKGRSSGWFDTSEIEEIMEMDYAPSEHVVDKLFQTIVEEVYGIRSIDIQDDIYHRVLNKMYNRINRGWYLNESVDKKEIYLNYIVNTFIDRHLTIDDLGDEIMVFLRVENNGSGRIFLDTKKEHFKESIKGEIAAGYMPDNYMIDSMFALIMEEYYDIYGEKEQNFIRIKIFNELGNRISKMTLNESESKGDRFEQFIYDDFINNFVKTNGRGSFTFLPPIEEDDPHSWVNWGMNDIRTDDTSTGLRFLNPDFGYTEWFLPNRIVEVFNTRYGINDLNKIQDIWFSICDRILLKLIDERDSRKIS